MKIKDLPEPYREMALIEMEAQGRLRDCELSLMQAISWSRALCNHTFWHAVYCRLNPEITPEIKAKFPSVFKDELIEKWLKQKAKYEELAKKYENNQLQHYKYIHKALAVRDCIKDYEQFINLKK
jgi:hypothetical protein